MIRRPPRSTQSRSSAASDVYKRQALYSLKDLKRCKYITVHANGGLEMLRAIKKKAKSINKDLKVLGVTILTSLNNKSLKDIGHTKSVEQLVLKQAGLIKKSGCDGIVCLSLIHI